MHVAGHVYDLLSPGEMALIHKGAVRILDEMGMQVETTRLLHMLGDLGLQVDLESQRVRFSSSLVERLITEADKRDWEHIAPRMSGSAGVYHSLYHDPASDRLAPWTEEALVTYFALVRRLAHVEGASVLGCRLPVPPTLEPLYERYMSWK